MVMIQIHLPIHTITLCLAIPRLSHVYEGLGFKIRAKEIEPWFPRMERMGLA
jgi:hypothetical protein